MASPFETEVVLDTSKCMQQENADLIKKLADCRQKRAALERNGDALKTKLTQTKEVNRKMSATLNVAEHKVSESQTELNSLQNLLSVTDDRVKHLSTQIDRKREARYEETLRFENELDRLATKFYEARRYYDDEKLQERIAQTDREKDNIRREAHHFSKLRDELVTSLEQLRLESAKADDMANEMGAPTEQQQRVLLMVTEEIQCLNRIVANLQDKEENLKKELTAV